MPTAASRYRCPSGSYPRISSSLKMEFMTNRYYCSSFFLFRKQPRSETVLAHRLRTVYPLFASETQAKARPKSKSKAGTGVPVCVGLTPFRDWKSLTFAELITMDCTSIATAVLVKAGLASIETQVPATLSCYFSSSHSAS